MLRISKIVNIKSLKKNEIYEEENKKEGRQSESSNNHIFRTLYRTLGRLVEMC